MSFLSPKHKTILLISVVTIAFGIFFGLSPHKASVQQDDQFVLKAKNMMSSNNNISVTNIKVANEAIANYKYSGKKAHKVELIDDKGNMSDITLDENGNTVDEGALRKEDFAAKQTKYGKFDPSFSDKLANAPQDTPINATLWLKIPPFKPYDRPDPRQKATPDEVQNYYKKLDAYINSKIDPTVASTAAKIKALGYDVKTNNSAGTINLDISPKILKEFEKWGEIDEIIQGDKNVEPMLGSAGYATGAYYVNNQKIDGTGVKVAQIEAGIFGDPNGRIALSNPYIKSSNITQDTTYLGSPCDLPAPHATEVAGTMLSLYDSDKGHSPGVSLWAGGSCLGLPWELNNRSTAAVDWGAQVLNLSWGKQDEDKPGDDDRFYDDIVYNHFRSVVVAAGNNGANANNIDCAYGGSNQSNKINRPALGYNSITVGAYNDNNTPWGSDDSFFPCSSWKNPPSVWNDREKPDIVAPGQAINTLYNKSPWMTNDINSNNSDHSRWPVHGTSFAAPMVSAGLALLIQRNSYLGTWPEILKALTIATSKNLKGAPLPPIGVDSQDGFGAVNFNLADSLLKNNTYGGFGNGSITCSSPYLTEQKINLTKGLQTRAVLVFDVDPAYYDYANEPNINLDLSLLDPNGNTIASSTRYDSTVEVVSFIPTVSGVYTLQIHKFFCDPTYNHTYYGVAWNQLATYTAQYFNNQTLSGTPTITQNEDDVNFNWKLFSPDPSLIPGDHFSARWTTTLSFPAGTYEFNSIADNGVRLYIDGVKIIDQWKNQTVTTNTVSKTLTAGNHTITYEYYHNTGASQVQLTYQKVPVVSGGIYKVTNECGGKVLDVVMGSKADGANIDTWSWGGGTNQKWKIDEIGQGLYKFTSQNSGKVMDVVAGSLLDGANVDQWALGNGTNQQWTITSVKNGYYMILNKGSGKALDVAGGSTSNGANVDQWKNQDGCNQHWKIEGV